MVDVTKVDNTRASERDLLPADVNLGARAQPGHGAIFSDVIEVFVDG